MPERLRVIFCRFRGVSGGASERFFATTEGGPPTDKPDFILINVEKFRHDGSSLVHEMIHAAGLWDHDTDNDSIFADGATRTGTTLKPVHAAKLTQAFFAFRLKT
jgi:hypothetical protein